ncbi:MAG: ATP-binding cassette domain-containing protein [Veillonella sp.]|nr:ATP-binding cassette domain-containing protein [Veillonella sp.]
MITFSFTVARPSVTVKADGVLPSGITVLTGQSGSGKSTFIKCIAGLVKPTTGSIHCNETTWVDRDNKIWVPAQKRDEPLSALDWNLRKHVREDLVSIIREWDVPCVWVTHDESEAEMVGDRHWTCEEGQIQISK